MIIKIVKGSKRAEEAKEAEEGKGAEEAKSIAQRAEGREHRDSLETDFTDTIGKEQGARGKQTASLRLCAINKLREFKTLEY